jgi:hypothetical protein
LSVTLVAEAEELLVSVKVTGDELEPTFTEPKFSDDGVRVRLPLDESAS